MYLEDDVVALTIGYLHLLQRVLQLGAPCTAATAGSVVVDNEVALGIVATGGAYHIDKALGVLVDGIVGGTALCKIPGAFGVEHLVIAFEQQQLAIVAELLGYLLPQFLIAGLVGSVVGFIGLDPMVAGEVLLAVVAVGTRVVVYVEDAVHSLADDIVNHLMYAVHPCCIHVAVLVHVVIPCHGNADGSETGFFHHGHQFCLGG